MSQHGNRSQPNGVRVDGKPEMSPENPNRGDLTDAAHADSKSAGGRDPMTAQGSQQENRDHHKHNDGGQSGHKAQSHHSPAQEKQ